MGYLKSSSGIEKTTGMLESSDRKPRGSKKQQSSNSGNGGGGGLFRMFKLVPMLSSGSKALISLLNGRNRRIPLLTENVSAIGTLFGYRKGKLNLAIQDDPHHLPIFTVELPILTAFLHKEMASDVLRIALESDTKTPKRKLLEEFVWAVYCNGRKMGYSIRRLYMTDDEVRVINLLKGISMGAGVLPLPSSEMESADGEMTYVRARFERVVGSKNSESFYIINPAADRASAQELSIFFLRLH